MYIRELDDCAEITAGDNTLLREIINPLIDPLSLRYSLAHARVAPGATTLPHRLNNSEVYYILEGEGEMTIDGEKGALKPGSTVYIPPESMQFVKNTGPGELVFICIVDPAWRKEDELVGQ